MTSIFVADQGHTDPVYAQFDAGSILDLSFSGIAPTPGTWTLMEVENGLITDDGLGLSGTTDSNWSFNVDNTGANGLLTATYVPEPGTMVLLAGGLGMLSLFRRRR